MPFVSNLAGELGKQAISKIGEKAVETGATTAGGAAAGSAAASTVGRVASGVLGAATGAYSVFTGIQGVNSATDSFRNDRLSNSQIDATSS